eukprot:gene13740-19643_t
MCGKLANTGVLVFDTDPSAVFSSCTFVRWYFQPSAPRPRRIEARLYRAQTQASIQARDADIHLASDGLPSALFAEGADALSWDSDELTKIRNLHSKVFTDKEISILENDLKAWFGHLDHILPHTRIKLSELTCAEDGHCAGVVHGQMAAPSSPVHSFVHLNFTCEVDATRMDHLVDSFMAAIGLQNSYTPLVDATRMDHLVDSFMAAIGLQNSYTPLVDATRMDRFVDSFMAVIGLQNSNTPLVDATRMERFVDSFMGAIGLQNSYAILVMNPDSLAHDPQYGYRKGLSHQEMEHTREHLSANGIAELLAVTRKQGTKSRGPSHEGKAGTEGGQARESQDGQDTREGQARGKPGFRGKPRGKARHEEARRGKPRGKAGTRKAARGKPGGLQANEGRPAQGNVPGTMESQDGTRATSWKAGKRDGSGTTKARGPSHEGGQARGIGQARKRQHTHSEPEPPLNFAAQWQRAKAKGVKGKFSSSDATWQTEYWANDAENYLHEEELFQKSLFDWIGTGKGTQALAQVVRVMAYQEGHLAAVLKEDLMGSEDLSYAKLYSKFETMHPAEDCLVGNWVGTGRWLFMDLTAAASGHEWGPAQGGDGYVHKDVVPSVDRHFKKLDEKKKEERGKARKYGTPEYTAYEAMGKEKRDHLVSVTNTRYREYVTERQQRKFAASAPGGARFDHKQEQLIWQKLSAEHMAKAEIDFLETFARSHCADKARPHKMCAHVPSWYQPKSPLKPPAPLHSFKFQFFEITAAAEIDFLETFARRHCADKARPPKMCAEIREDISNQMKLLNRIATTSNEFPETTKIQTEPRKEEETRAKDLFMAEMAAVLSRAMRHVLAPPSVAWTHDKTLGQRHDTAGVYTKH